MSDDNKKKSGSRNQDQAAGDTSGTMTHATSPEKVKASGADQKTGASAQDDTNEEERAETDGKMGASDHKPGAPAPKPAAPAPKPSKHDGQKVSQGERKSSEFVTDPGFKPAPGHSEVHDPMSPPPQAKSGMDGVASQARK
jgi:hypothetical protein